MTYLMCLALHISNIIQKIRPVKNHNKMFILHKDTIYEYIIIICKVYLDSIVPAVYGCFV